MNLQAKKNRAWPLLFHERTRLFLAIIAIVFAPAALALTCTSTATGGNWSLAATWTGCGGGVPGNADTAVIATTSPNVVTADVNITVGNVIINSGQLSVAGSNWTVNGTTTVNNGGTIDQTNAGGNATFIGLVTVNSGGTWSDTAGENVTFRGGITNNGTFNGGVGAMTFANNNQALGGANPINFAGTVTINSNLVVTNNGIVTMSGILTRGNGNSTWVNGTNSTLNYDSPTAPMAGAIFTASAAGNTVNYTNGTGGQTAAPTTYVNLTLSGSGTKTVAGVTVNGVLSMEGTATASVAPTYGPNATLQYNTDTARAAGFEWITPFAASGGVIIGNSGAITLNSAKVFNASVPLTINSGATLNTSAANNWSLTLGGNFVNNGGTFIANASPIFIANTMAAQSIAGFTTSGLVSMAKTAGTATFTGNVSGGGLTINGTGGTLNLGASLTHTFSGNWTRTAGTLSGGSSRLNIGGSCSGAGGTFTAGTGTVDWNAGGAQTVCPVSYNNLTLSNGGAKTMTSVITIGGNLSISGAATMTGNAALAVTGALNYSSSGTTTLTAATPISIGSFNQTAGTVTAGANTVTVSGNWNGTGIFSTTGTVKLSGATVQTISGTSPAAFSTLNVTNAASPNVTLATNVTATTLTGTVRLTPSCPDFTLTSTSPAQVLHSCTVVSSISLAGASPTGAATVSWTVVFNNSVTGVDATAFSLVPGGGLSGTFISTVTGSAATWTVTANTGIGSGSLGLNQTGPGSVVPTLSGAFTGQAYTISATTALAEYRMDEASWNGTAGEVVDSSGSGNNARALNSANTTDGSRAIPGSPGTCRYGVFDNGTTITKGYVQTPLANLTTDFTVTAWMRSNSAATLGQRILVDDQGEATGYGFSFSDAGTGVLRFYSRGIAPVILDSTFTIVPGTWYFVAAVADITNRRRTIYVFNAAGTLLSSTSDAAAFTGTWTADAGPVTVGGTPTYHFNGNLDEVRVYQKVLNSTALAAIAAQKHACAGTVPDHLVIQSSGSGLTCAANTLTVAACQDVSCATPFTLGVSGTLSATGTPTVNWDGTTGGAAGAGFVIPGGSSSVTKNVQVATAGTVVFGITGPAPVPTNTTTCSFGSPLCTFTANTAGFIYSSTTTGSSYTIPEQSSGVATSTLYLRALQSATNNPAVCTPAIVSQTVPVNMGYACNNPASCQAGNLATINATAVAPGGTAVNLSFDANGSAPITARYDDVGQITLNASKTVTPFGGATPVTLAGSSNAYVVRPHHFDLSGIQQTAAPNLANPGAAIATDPKFVKAGEAFTVTVTARNFLNAATPNYGKETPAESVKLTPLLAAPAGGNIPALGAGTFGAFSGGVATGTNFTWNEVGIITLTPSVGDADYLGTGDMSGTTSGNVGRFYPDHFSLSAGSLANRGGACTPASAFTYLGEALNLQLTLTAQSSGGGTTQNYDGILAGGGFAKLAPGTFSNYGLGARSGTSNLTSRISGTISTPPVWTLGVLSNVTVATTVARNAAADGPWTGTQFGIAPGDSDGTQMLTSALNLDVDNNAVNDHQAVGATTELRFGRLRLLNAYGSELLPILLPVRAEYLNSNNWRVNPDDSCTVLTPGALAIGNITKPAGSTLAFSTPPTGVTGSLSATLTTGVTSLRITPAVNGVGSADVILNLGGAIGMTSCVTLSGQVGGATPAPTLPHLAGNWCGTTYDKAPVARIKFGSPRAPYIYLRERY